MASKNKKRVEEVASTETKLGLVELLAQKLKDWGIHPDEQSLHFRTDRFGDSFPDVSAKPTADDLTQNIWWWNMAKTGDCESIFSNKYGEFFPQLLLQIFKDHYETSAFFYEMRARYAGRYKWDFDCPWARCSLEQWRFLACLVPNKHPARLFLPTNLEDPNWIALEKQFNLKLSDETLNEQFRDEMVALRKRVNIPRPGKGQGTPRREFSWKPIEFLDIQHYKIKPLNESERSHISRAKKAYITTCKVLKIDP